MAAWTTSVWTAAGEATVAIESVSRALSNPRRFIGDRANLRRRSNRRARAHIRRFAVANGLRRLITLTCEEACTDRAEMMRSTVRFTRTVRNLSGNFVWAVSLEEHPGGHGFHVHILVGHRLAPGVIARAWPHGRTHEVKIRSVRGGRDASRLAAWYLLKSLDEKLDDRPLGTHAYEVSQGSQPVGIVLFAKTSSEARKLAIAIMGGVLPDFEWWSDNEFAWAAPPVGYLSWN